MLVLTDEQAMLRDGARELVQGAFPLSRHRAWRDAGGGHDAQGWSELVEQGWAALTVPESRGGMGLGLAELAVVMEALGRHLVPTPLLSSLLTSRLAPALAVAEGEFAAVAWREHPRHADPEVCNTRELHGRLTGIKPAVLDAAGATCLLVTARDPDGVLGVYLVQRAEVELQPLVRLDHRDCARLVLDNAPAERLDLPAGALQQALDEATVALSAELLGGADKAFELTRAYLAERRQFGVPIGSFQALQHRAVDVFTQLELARSTVMAAAREPTVELVSLCKAQCSEAFLHTCKEAVQLFGGIGMTDEHDIGFFLKRAQVGAQTLGDAAWHRDRWARARGY
jgi:alkylation response protein AidB-like acyl-CoA dehydrogenase